MHPELPIRPGERVVWTGVPDPAVNFTRGDLYLIPFSLFFFGFAAFWLISAARASQAGPVLVFGSVLVLFGLYHLVGRFFVKAWNKRRTSYAITDQRALAVTGATTREVALPASAITTTRSRDGRHLSVLFTTPVPRSGRASMYRSNVSLYRNTGLDFFLGGDGVLGFYDVEDVAGLQSALDRLQAPSR